MANMVGKVLGKYQIVELLGKGGMAEVYKAWHPTLDRFITIKVLYSYLAEGHDFQARFAREARAIASLRHTHIVQIYDFEVEGDVYYMVMEYIDGGNLQERMLELSKNNQFMPYEEVLAVLQNVAEALDYAHRRGIIHRDIKPSNILLDSSGSAYLADFGIARMLSATPFTSTGSLIGTPAYMSPEQGQGGDVTFSTDLYSLGVVVFELLTGRVPFTSNTTPLAVIHKHITELPPPPCSLRPDLPEAAERVILKALAKDPRERYASAMELVLALEKALFPARPGLEVDSAAAVASPVSQPIQLAAAPPVTPVGPAVQPVHEVLDETLKAAVREQPVLASGTAVKEKPAKIKKPRKNPLIPAILGLLGILIIGFGAVRFLPALRPASTPALTSTAPPTRAVPKLVPTLKPFTPTPPPTPTSYQLVSSLYDGFDDPAFDGAFNTKLWMRVDNNPNSTVTQHAGFLIIDEQSGITELIATGFRNFSIREPMYFQVWVKLIAKVGTANLILTTDKFGMYCDVYNLDSGKGQASCFGGTESPLPRLGKVDFLSARDWHILRVEVYPDTMRFVCSLDGALLYEGVPTNAGNYRQAPFRFIIEATDNGQKSEHTIANFDYVTVGIIK